MKRYTDDFITTVMKEVKTGAFVQDIAAKHGINYGLIIGWANVLKMSFNKAPRKPRGAFHDWNKIKEMVEASA